jgi:hypothetical protein
MKCEPRPIFRAEAVRRYAQSQDRAVLPRTACPRTVFYLWALLGLLLLVGGLTSWTVRGSISPGVGPSAIARSRAAHDTARTSRSDVIPTVRDLGRSRDVTAVRVPMSGRRVLVLRAEYE